ncbi:DsbA family protein [Rhodobacteraceae bacterium N5(2021)]|uniref:DsbA family protein n=1 Tax=Gymnodinialimonas phycosphaerae TaxID=2841589 RepID=A0A975YH50_9RHOB|nr:DsbA family protein [Gymnodinialimonas phycosphaerae]MBY4892403.1 DsbA family protein [Gymnodinialimonas phycosphaerae]
MKRMLMSVAAVAMLALPLGATEIGDMTDAERQAFRAEVRQYLLDNPEVLMEAIGVLEQRQAEEEAAAQEVAVAENAPALFNSSFDHVGGNLDGDVVIVEFVDYRCSFCRRAHPEVAELIETDGNIRIITKEFPILGEQSVLASRFAIATSIALGGEAYELVRDGLMAMRSDVTELALARLADDLSLDSEAIFAAMDDPLVQTTIDANYALGQRMGITGTPSFVFGDQLVQGYVPLSNMQDIVAIIRDTAG